VITNFIIQISDRLVRIDEVTCEAPEATDGAVDAGGVSSVANGHVVLLRGPGGPIHTGCYTAWYPNANITPSHGDVTVEPLMTYKKNQLVWVRNWFE
jgi:hypothetical protein